MKTIDEIRHENLLLLIGEFGTVQALATRVGKSHAQISQLKTRAVHSTTGKRRSMGDELARSIEEKCDLPVGWFDTPHTLTKDKVSASVRPKTTASVASIPSHRTHRDPHIRKAIEILESLDREGRIEALGALKIVAASHHKHPARPTSKGS